MSEEITCVTEIVKNIYFTNKKLKKILFVWLEDIVIKCLRVSGAGLLFLSDRSSCESWIYRLDNSTGTIYFIKGTIARTSIGVPRLLFSLERILSPCSLVFIFPQFYSLYIRIFRVYVDYSGWKKWHTKENYFRSSRSVKGKNYLRNVRCVYRKFEITSVHLQWRMTMFGYFDNNVNPESWQYRYINDFRLQNVELICFTLVNRTFLSIEITTSSSPQD